MPDLLDQLQLLAECGYLSDMWAAPYINEQVKQEQAALFSGGFHFFPTEGSGFVPIDFSDIPADDFVD